MNTTHPPATTTTGLSAPTRSRRRWRYRLLGLVIFAVTIALLYAEENWRGRRAWENCKRELEAKGAKLDWSYYVPPPVPDDQNIFGVPEMQKWLVGRGPTELSKKLNILRGNDNIISNSPRIVVANLTIGLPGASPPAGSIVLAWADKKNAETQTAFLIRQALGPLARDPLGFDLMAKKREEVRPVQIFLQCQTAPAEKDLEQLLPNPIAPQVGTMNGSYNDWEKVKLEPTSGNSYQVTMYAPISAVDYVKWNEKIEPDLAIIRQAVQRPYARMPGDYGYPLDIPVPNFVTARVVSQDLSALARCYLLLGQTGKALEEVTLMHQLCRMLEARPTGRPMTLVAAMINVAFTGLYVDTIKEGMRMQAWQEPQLAALQEQLREIDLRSYLAGAFDFEQGWVCTVEMTPLTEMGKIWRISDKPADRTKMLSFPYSAVPRGWYYQNMVVCANFHQVFIDDFSSAGQLVVPHKLDSFNSMMDALVSRRSPFIYLAAIAIPNYPRAAMTYTHNQTLANQAQIVCALERHRLARGQYPATLEELTPQFIEKIPRDLIGGQPPHYRRNADGTFLLYSIGWTEQDHGGQAGPKDTEGDWVWGAD